MTDPLGTGAERPIDLRTDAMTYPTDTMWAAMRTADLGWAVAGEDGSVTALEQLAAELLGHRAAVFVPTGSMGNLVALMSHAERGQQIVLEASSHLIETEGASIGYVCGLVTRPLEGDRGRLDPGAVRAAIADRKLSDRPATAVVCVENTHNAAGGAVLSSADVEPVLAVAREHGVRTHLDGARLLNAAAALGCAPRELAETFDSVVLSLNKGLSAPLGAVLCGDPAFALRARANLKRLGAHSFHQAGIYAAAGIAALETMLEQPAADNRTARQLADHLAALPGLGVDPESVDSNIVVAKVLDPEIEPNAYLDALLRAGVRALSFGDRTLRFVTHRHFRDEDVRRVAAAVEGALAEFAAARVP